VTEIPRIEPAVGQTADRDQETARLLMRGDHEGLRRLLVDHAGKVLALLRKEFLRVLDFQEIEDAVAQASTRAWRSGSRFDPSRGSLGAWFFTIARNCARRVLETKGRHATLSLVEDLDSTATAVAARADDAAPDRAMAADSFLADVRRCIEALAPQQRAVLMADFAAGGMASNDELATQLGTTKNSIYVSRNNGRRNLRAAMAKLGHTFDGTSAAALREWQ
jgi:RNA polymerase sigma-70 factor (ECF subfamily)